MNKDINVEDLVLKTDRLELRAWKLDDLDDFYEYAKVEGVGEMAGWLHHKSIDESRKILSMFISSKRELAIIYQNKAIGSIGIKEYNTKLLPEYDNKYGCEIGFVLSKDYHNRGFMSEALNSVITYLFKVEKVDFIVAGHFKFNKKSEAIQNKFGFKPIKEYIYKTYYGEEHETILRVLTKNPCLS